ncbi:hypothetical protein LTR97_009628 [Elasticomyces elasticus]|uniref:PPPDE domain-containing protein n=1 Tax=Elasticomyces elasticus TaxID=574655 RepID=A0AAN7VZD7_9PEZI|nr:hypothetical protein LTR97_009628 [Elasticomyces elasticus]
MPTKNRFTTTQSPSNKTAITLNIYDLLPPGSLSTLLWTLGSSLLHSGVQIAPPTINPHSHHVAREYAYGGHNRRSTTGVYYTPPLQTPPGGTFRTSILIGHTSLSPAQIDSAIREVSEQFLGTSYNLLTNNCNHFSSALLLRLTGKTAPRWLNRAAGVGLAVPCMVPKEWVGPPPAPGLQQTAEGELMSPDPGEDDEDEEAAMLDFDRRRQEREQRRRERGRRSRQVSAGNIVVPERSEDPVSGVGQEERGGSRERQDGGSTQQDGGADEVGSSLAGGPKITGPVGTPPPRLVSVRDTSGRAMPVAERAPVPAKLR